MSSNLVTTLAVLPLCLWLRDYSAMLWVLLLQAACATLGSHLLADRPYGWTWDRHYGHRMFGFGWPLLINGLLMYGIFEGDRFIIGAAHKMFPTSVLTLTDLGVYSVAFSVTMAPAVLVSNISTTVFFPYLARAQKDMAEFERRYFSFSQILALTAAIIAIPFIAAGGNMVALVYGVKYAGVGSFIGWLAGLWALRILRVVPTAAAMALGDTRNALVANIARTAALPGVLLVVASGRGLVMIAVCGFLGELAALVVCLWRLQIRHGIAAGICYRTFTISAVGIGIATICVLLGLTQLGRAAAFGLGIALVIAQIVGALAVFPELRGHFGQLVRAVPAHLAREGTS